MADPATCLASKTVYCTLFSSENSLFYSVREIVLSFYYYFNTFMFPQAASCAAISVSTLYRFLLLKSFHSGSFLMDRGPCCRTYWRIWIIILNSFRWIIALLCCTVSLYSIRYSVMAIFTLWFCCSVMYIRHLLHVCPPWERDPSSVALPEVFFHLFC